MSSPKRPKLSDVARLAGVSQAAVSVVLNNRVGDSARVSETTQAKIWEAVRQLGYVANPMARNLAGGRTRIIAVFTFEAIFPTEPHNFFYPFFMGIEEEAEAHGYNLLLVTGTRDQEQRRRIYQHGVNELQMADGAILLGHGDRSETLNLLAEGYPFVYVGRRDAPQDNISYAAADYASATIQVVQYMFEQQHRHIAYLQQLSKIQHESSQDRVTGFQAAYQQMGVPLDAAQFWEGEIEHLTPASLQAFLAQGITAFICEDERIGHRVISVAETMGLRVPQDFSLAVLGDPLSLVELDYGWTTFKIPRREMGRSAVRLLVEMLNETWEAYPPVYRVVLPCTFVPGKTVAPPGQERS